MSLADTMVSRVSAAYDRVHADTWTILSAGDLSGTTFTADMQSEAVLAFDTDLGSDARAKSFLYLSRAELDRKPGLLEALERSKKISGKGAEWMLIGDRDDNPANDRVRFEILKKSVKDS